MSRRLTILLTVVAGIVVAGLIVGVVLLTTDDDSSTTTTAKAIATTTVDERVHPSVAVTCAPVPAAVAKPVACAATVTSAKAAGLVTGTITWRFGPMGGHAGGESFRCSLQPAGQQVSTCAAPLSFPRPGGWVVYGAYNGSTEYLPTSGAAGITVA